MADSAQFTEPGFHSVARAPHDSKPIIEVQHQGVTFDFTIEFAAGTNSAERLVMRFHEDRAREAPIVIRKDELLFTRSMIPTGHQVIVKVRWEPVAPKGGER